MSAPDDELPEDPAERDALIEAAASAVACARA
jgi:hypothetical protein